MKKNLFVVALMALVVVLGAGCSHNVGMAFTGKLLNLGYDPELNKVGVQFYDGVMISGVNRENSEHSLEWESNNQSRQTENAELGSKLKYKARVGRQITGYYVDALNAGAKPDELDKYAKELPADVGGGAEQEVAQPPNPIKPPQAPQDDSTEQ